MVTRFYESTPANRFDWPENLLQVVKLAKSSIIPTTIEVQALDGGTERSFAVTRLAAGPIRNRFGSFTLAIFEVNDPWINYYALIKGEVDDLLWPLFRNTDIPVRIDSGCLTGRVFGDLTCDCGEQLNLAMERISDVGEGIIVNIPGQDGRGLGLPTKLAALRMFDELGFDTCTATTILTLAGNIEGRSYGGAIAVVRALGISSANRIVVLSNNPEKLKAFVENGLQCELQPIKSPATPLTLPHLQAKQKVLGHIGVGDDEH